MKRLRIIACSIAIFAIYSSQIFAQDSSSSAAKDIDEIIVEGQSNWAGHKGMNAFNRGDFATAEIEFEREFKSLKRQLSGLKNSVVAAQNNEFRAEIDTFNTSGASAAGASSGSQGSSPTSTTMGGQFKSKRDQGRNILNDGVVSDIDFALTKYMSGLSEIKLGKIAEAKSSLKTAIHYDGGNHDARMRLGLIYVQESKMKKAGKQLKALNKIRKKCKAKSCDDYELIKKSVVTLATAIIQNTEAQ